MVEHQRFLSLWEFSGMAIMIKEPRRKIDLGGAPVRTAVATGPGRLHFVEGAVLFPALECSLWP